jgi:hypothetical protein
MKKKIEINAHFRDRKLQLKQKNNIFEQKI